MLESLYRAGFFVVIKIKKFLGQHDCSPFRVISIGNLSVGGTGKSVFVQFLSKHFPKDSIAIFLRGYKGSISRSGKNVVIHAGNIEQFDVSEIGDEASMLLRAGIPLVVVGRDRKKSFFD